MHVVFNETLTKLECPDCRQWIDLPLEILGLHLQVNREQLEVEVRRHVAQAPQQHPTFCTVHP